MYVNGSVSYWVTMEAPDQHNILFSYERKTHRRVRERETEIAIGRYADDISYSKKKNYYHPTRHTGLL